MNFFSQGCHDFFGVAGAANDKEGVIVGLIRRDNIDIHGEIVSDKELRLE